MRAAGWAVLAVLVLGCAPVAPRSEHRGPSVASRAPKPPAQPPISAPPPAETMAEPPPPAPSPFAAEAELTGGITGLHAAGEYLLVEQGHPKRLELTALAPFKNGVLDVDAKHWAGLPNIARADAIVGKWPNVSAFVWQAGASSEYGFLFRHSARGWVRQARLEEHHVFRSIDRSGRRTVALTAPAPLLYPGATKLVELIAGGLVPGPSLTKAAAPCPAAIVPRHVVGDGHGRVFVFGRRCLAKPGASDFAEGAPAVEWFARGSRRGSVVDLPPEASGEPVVIAGDSARVVFSLSETSRRLSFDGAGFALGERTGPRLWRLERAADATRFAVRADNRILRAPPGSDDESWEELPLPETPEPCSARACSIPLAIVGAETYIAIGERLYRHGASARSPLPKYAIGDIAKD